MQGVDVQLRFHGASGGHQRLAGNLAPVDPLAVDVGAVASEDVDLDRLEVEQIDEAVHGALIHRSILAGEARSSAATGCDCGRGTSAVQPGLGAASTGTGGTRRAVAGARRAVCWMGRYARTGREGDAATSAEPRPLRRGAQAAAIRRGVARVRAAGPDPDPDLRRARVHDPRTPTAPTDVNWVAASIASAAVLTVPNFFANKYWVWREHLQGQPPHPGDRLLGRGHARGGLATLLTYWVGRRHRGPRHLGERGCVRCSAHGLRHRVARPLLHPGRWLFKVTHHGEDPSEDDLEMMHGDLPV